MQLNMKQFKKMGGRYLFSSIPIMNPCANRLRLLNVFDDPDSAWRIYVYEAL
jgi:hypothetical protein